jgi:transposase
VTIAPLIQRTIAQGSVVYTDEYDIYSRLDDWGYVMAGVKTERGPV